MQIKKNVIFCFAGDFSVNTSMFDVGVTLVFAVIAYLFDKLGFSTIPVLLGLVLGAITEENFRRSLILSDGSYKLFVQSPIAIAFLVVIFLTVAIIGINKIQESKRSI